MGMYFNMYGAGNKMIAFNNKKTYTFNNSLYKGVTFDGYYWNGYVSLPNGITYVDFLYTMNYNKPITLPSTVTNFSISSAEFNKPITLPNGIKYFSINCKKFNLPITIPSGVTEISFSGCEMFNQPITIPSGVTNCMQMFSNCANFNRPITIPSGVTNCIRMFSNCANFNQLITIPNGVTMCDYMLYNCQNFNQPITIPNTVTLAENLFRKCINLASDIHIYCNYNFSNGEAVGWGFDSCNNIRNIYFHSTNIGFYYAHFRNNNRCQLNIFIRNTINARGSNINANYFVDETSYKLSWSGNSNVRYNTYYNIFIYNNLTS